MCKIIYNYFFVNSWATFFAFCLCLSLPYTFKLSWIYLLLYILLLFWIYINKITIIEDIWHEKNMIFFNSIKKGATKSKLTKIFQNIHIDFFQGWYAGTTCSTIERISNSSHNLWNSLPFATPIRTWMFLLLPAKKTCCNYKAIFSVWNRLRNYKIIWKLNG